jgi:hypothetical protein
MSEHIKVNVDVSTGAVSIECPEAALEAILSRVAEFMPKLAALRAPEPENPVQSSEDRTSNPQSPDEGKPGSRRGSKQKAASPTYKMVDLGIGDDAKRTFKKWFDEKKPRSQNDQVLLCAFWLNKTLKRDTFTDDDVFTALRTAGVPKIPARIESVISNLKLENRLVGEKGKYKINHIGEDFINNELPPQATKQ